MDDQNQPQLGQLVRVLRGRDEGKYAVVVGLIDERYIYIADGYKRKFDRPKKKNIIHLHFYDDISSEVAKSLQETGRVTNAKLRHAVQKFAEKQQAGEKGG